MNHSSTSERNAVVSFIVTTIVLALLVLIPATETKLLWIFYGMLVIISMTAKKINIQIYYLFLAVLFPLTEIFWNAFKYEGVLTNTELIDQNMLAFAFVGWASYVILVILFPILALIFRILLRNLLYSDKKEFSLQ